MSVNLWPELCINIAGEELICDWLEGTDWLVTMVGLSWTTGLVVTVGVALSSRLTTGLGWKVTLWPPTCPDGIWGLSLVSWEAPSCEAPGSSDTGVEVADGTVGLSRLDTLDGWPDSESVGVSPNSEVPGSPSETGPRRVARCETDVCEGAIWEQNKRSELLRKGEFSRE